MLDENQLDLVNREQAQNDSLDPSYAQFRDQTRFWIQRVAVPLIMVVGLFGNLVTVIIMTRRRMRSTTNMYLAALALVDMLYLVLTFLLGLSHYPNMAGKRYYLYWKLRPFLMMLTDACSNTSVWLTVTFTIERFIAVKYPMKGKVWCTEARAKKLIVFVFLLGILFASPVPFEWKVVEKPVKKEQAKQLESFNITNFGSLGSIDSSHGEIPTFRDADEKFESSLSNNERGQQRDDDDSKSEENAYILSLDYSDFGRNETYKTIYYWSTAVIFYFIPLLSLTFFNGFLILSVHRSFRERKRMTSGQQSYARGQQNQGQQQRDARVKELQCNKNRLIIPKIAIEGGQTKILEGGDGHDENGAVNVETNQRISWEESAFSDESEKQRPPPQEEVSFVEFSNPESDSCQHELISGSDLELPSTDKIVQVGYNKPNESNSIDQHESSRTSSIAIGADTSSARVHHTDRKVEFNCDADIDGGGTLDVHQANCDKANNNNGLNPTHGEVVVNGTNFSNGGEKDTKFFIVVPILRMNHETPSSEQVSLTSIALHLNQLETSDDDDVTTGASRLKQVSELSAHRDNTVAPSGTSGSLEDAQHSQPVSGFPTTKIAPQTADSRRVANNSHHPRSSVESTSHSSGKFKLINSTVSSGLAHNNNYDSGSCTTIQTTASLVPVSTQERRITIMLIAVVILFLCCQIPSAAMLLYTSVREPAPNTNEHALVLAFGNIFNFLMAVNAAGNFILYSFLSKKYRNTFMILFCDCFKGKGSDSDERQRAGLSTQQLAMGGHHSTSPSGGGLCDESRRTSKDRGGHLKRWTRAHFVRSKLAASSREPKLQPGDIGNYLVSGSFKQKRRDTLV